MRPTEGPQKETGQLGGFNDETGAQSRVKTNRNRLLRVVFSYEYEKEYRYYDS